MNRKMKIMKIEKLLEGEQLKLAGKGFTRLVLFYERMARRGFYSTFAAVENTEILGVLFASNFSRPTGNIKYVFVKEHSRNKGIAQALLRNALLSFWDGGSKSVCMEVPVNISESLENIAEKIGFYKKKESISVVNPNNSETRAVFKDYMETTGEKLEKFMLRRKFFIKPFSDATVQELDALCTQVGNGYPSYLDPFHMEHERVDDGSFLVLKNNHVVGYLALGKIKGQESVVEVSCRACLPEYQNTGVGVWTLLKSLEYIAEHPNIIKKVVFNIDAKDVKLTNMLGKVPVSFPGNFEQRLVMLCIDK